MNLSRRERYNQAVDFYKDGISISEISRKIGIGRRTINDWVKGKVNPEKLKFQSHYKVSDEEFTKIVQESFSIRECLRKQDSKPYGGNYFTFHQRVKRLNLSTDHFTGQAHLRGKNHNWVREVSVENAFVENGTMSSVNLKKKILKYKLKDCVCEICGIENWLNKPLSLHLDHANGINTDNRLENLRFLCPNCHSQTDTYCGKSKGSYK